jgi:hypothetical protein
MTMIAPPDLRSCLNLVMLTKQLPREPIRIFLINILVQIIVKEYYIFLDLRRSRTTLHASKTRSNGRATPDSTLMLTRLWKKLSSFLQVNSLRQGVSKSRLDNFNRHRPTWFSKPHYISHSLLE